MANVEVEGIDNVLNEIERRYSQKAMQSLSETAIRKAAEMFRDELVAEFGRVSGPYRTGATERETEVHGPTKDGRGNTVFIIRWRGDDDRYRLIHINEWGTAKNPNPPLKGTIDRTMKNVESRYYARIEEELKKGLS